MKFIVLEKANLGGQYFYPIDEMADIVGVSRRAIFDMLKKVSVEPWDRDTMLQKTYYSEDVLGRLWALHRRIGRTTPKPESLRSTEVQQKEKPAAVESQKAPQVQTQENRLAAKEAIARILSKV